MHATEARRILAYSVKQVLEIMCFSETEPASDPFESEHVITTSIGFHGSFSGCLRLEISGDAANWLAASFLGLREVTADSGAAEATVDELGNVICGCFLSLLDPSASVRIDPPAKQGLSSESADVVWQNFRADSGLLRVAFQFDSTNRE